MSETSKSTYILMLVDAIIIVLATFYAFISFAHINLISIICLWYLFVTMLILFEYKKSVPFLRRPSAGNVFYLLVCPYCRYARCFVI